MENTHEICSSAPSSLDFGVEPFQFHAGVFDAELPVHAPLLCVGFVGPSRDFLLQFDQIADATVAQALTRQATQLAFGNIQPTSVLGRVAEVDPLDGRPRLLRLEHLVERSFGVRVEVVANECHFLAIGIARVQQVSDFLRPIGFGPMLPSGGLSEAG